MSRRRLLLPVVFAAALFGLVDGTAPRALSQGSGGASDESFESADGVKLNGRFYKAQVTKNNSCVILLPGYKKDPTKGDWDGLARRLAGEGYNVLLLQYRGHGKSTDINGKEFFGDPVLGPINARLVPGATKMPPKNSLHMQELKPNYMPMLVNDIMAARSFLERKNDAGEVNVGTMHLIGSGDVVPLGLFYIAAEWHREAERPTNEFARRPFVNGNAGVAGAPVGKDIASAIWLGADRPAAMPDGAVKGFVSGYAPDMRNETRMLFLVADKNEHDRSKAKYFYDEVLVAKGNPGKKVEKMELTEVRTIKGAKSLTGVDLLGKNDTFGTEDIISKYLKAIEDDRKAKARYNRQYTAPLPIALQTFGISP